MNQRLLVLGWMVAVNALQAQEYTLFKSGDLGYTCF